MTSPVPPANAPAVPPANGTLQELQDSAKAQDIVQAVDKLLKEQGWEKIEGAREQHIAVAASLKSAKPDFTALVASLAVALPLLAAWLTTGHHSTDSPLFWPFLASCLPSFGSLLTFRDNGATEGVAAVLEHRAK